MNDEKNDLLDERLKPLVDVLSKASVGDFTADLKIPDVDDSLTQVYVGVQIMLEVVREKIEELEKTNQAKTEFVALASHQLRTPITIIKWYVELLNQKRESLDEEQRKYVEQIYTESQKMILLTNDLLDISRVEMGTFLVKPESLSVQQVTKDILKSYDPEIIKKKLQVKPEFSDFPSVYLDKRLLTIILQNLITNAITYTPDEGTITITLSMDDQDNVQIGILDTGCGIPKEQQQGVFSKLFRAENAKAIDPKGSGLGLYVVKSILDKVNGKVWFESEEGKGSKFYVSLPCSRTFVSI